VHFKGKQKKRKFNWQKLYRESKKDSGRDEMDKTKKAVRLKNNLTASYDWLGNKDSNLDRRSQSPFLHVHQLS